MDLRQLRSFTTLAQELHFGRAARRLNIVQPALSKQIKTLEDELGGPLLLRNRRGVALTHAGRLFLAEAELVLSHAARAVETARRASSGNTGRFRIGYSASAIHCGVYSAVVGSLRRSHPEVELDITSVDPWVQVDRLLAEDIDLAFGPWPLVRIPEAVSATLVATLPINVVLPKRHRLAAQASIVPGDLQGETFIEYADGGQMGYGVVERLLGFRPHTVRSAGDPLAVLVLVEAGKGISVLPAALAQPGLSGLVYRPLADANHGLKVAMLHLRAPADPFIARVCEAIEKSLAKKLSRAER